MIVTKLDIPCIWNGTLAGIMLKNDQTLAGKFERKTTKVICIHGWLDNLNSMLPLAQKLIDLHPNFEIYLYDRAGHGFSSHIPKGFDYSMSENLQDLRTVIQTLGWNKEKIIIIGHSYGAAIGMMYSACYAEEVSCLVLLDALPRIEATNEKIFQVYGSRIDGSLKFHNVPSRTFDVELTFDKALEVTKATRPGITDEAARLLTERSVRSVAEKKLHFTRDESLKLVPVSPPSTEENIRSAIQSIKAFVLLIEATNPQWPRNTRTLELFQEYQPTFEVACIDGPHHLHMTHVDEVIDRIEQYFHKYLPESSKLNSQL